MTDPRDDTVLLLRLAGTRSGVQAHHVPSCSIDAVRQLGGRVRFEGGRIYVPNAQSMLAAIYGICCRANNHHARGEPDIDSARPHAATGRKEP